VLHNVGAQFFEIVATDGGGIEVAKVQLLTRKFYLLTSVKY
jgi:hypothetical protein